MAPFILKSHAKYSKGWFPFSNGRLIQSSDIGTLSFKIISIDWTIYKENRREKQKEHTEHTREIRERKENILHQSIISQAYIFISFKVLDWKSNFSKYSLSHIDQILDILLEWAYCVQLLFERALSCTTNTLLNYWVFLLGFWYKS